MSSKVRRKRHKTLNWQELKIKLSYFPAKRRGKDRIWIAVRQDKPKNWRVASTLSYTRASDIQYERKKEG